MQIKLIIISLIVLFTSLNSSAKHNQNVKRKFAFNEKSPRDAYFHKLGRHLAKRKTNPKPSALTVEHQLTSKKTYRNVSSVPDVHGIGKSNNLTKNLNASKRAARYLPHKMQKAKHKTRKDIHTRVMRLRRKDEESEGFLASAWRKVSNLFGSAPTEVTTTELSIPIDSDDEVSVVKRGWIRPSPHQRKTRYEGYAQKHLKHKNSALMHQRHLPHRSKIRKKESSHIFKKHPMLKRSENVNKTSDNATEDSSNVLSSIWDKVKNYFALNSTTMATETWNKENIKARESSSKENIDTTESSNSENNTEFSNSSNPIENLNSNSSIEISPNKQEIKVRMYHHRLPIPKDNDENDAEKDTDDEIENSSERSKHDIKNRQMIDAVTSPPKKGIQLSKIIVKNIRNDIKEVIRIYDVSNDSLQYSLLRTGNGESLAINSLAKSVISNSNLPHNESKIDQIMSSLTTQGYHMALVTENSSAPGVKALEKAENVLLHSIENALDKVKDIVPSTNTTEGSEVKNISNKENLSTRKNSKNKHKFIPVQKTAESTKSTVLSNLLQTEETIISSTLTLAFNEGNGSGLIVLSSKEGTKKSGNVLRSDQKLEAIVEETNTTKEEITKIIHAKNDGKGKKEKKEKKSLVRDFLDTENLEDYDDQDISEKASRWKDKRESLQPESFNTRSKPTLAKKFQRNVKPDVLISEPVSLSPALNNSKTSPDYNKTHFTTEQATLSPALNETSSEALKAKRYEETMIQNISLSSSKPEISIDFYPNISEKDSFVNVNISQHLFSTPEAKVNSTGDKNISDATTGISVQKSGIRRRRKHVLRRNSLHGRRHKHLKRALRHIRHLVPYTKKSKRHQFEQPRRSANTSADNDTVTDKNNSYEILSTTEHKLNNKTSLIASDEQNEGNSSVTDSTNRTVRDVPSHKIGIRGKRNHILSIDAFPGRREKHPNTEWNIQYRIPDDEIYRRHQFEQTRRIGDSEMNDDIAEESTLFELDSRTEYELNDEPSLIASDELNEDESSITDSTTKAVTDVFSDTEIIPVDDT